MTPKELDKIKTALLNLLQDHGCPCPVIDIKADPESGIVTAEMAPGPPYIVDKVVLSKPEGIDPAIFNRYEAFRYGKPFDMRLFSLSSERTVGDALFVSAYYDVNCSSATPVIIQRVVEGRPRLYKVGVGFDTENYAIAKAQWRNSRIGMRASSLEGSVFASYIEQSAETSMQYYLRPATRLYLKPTASYKRLNETQFASAVSQAGLLPSTSWENGSLRADISGGPSVNHIETERGPGPARDTFFALGSQVDLKSHLFEYYAGEPQMGWRSSFNSISRIAGAYSVLTAHRFSLEGENLWNIGRYDPPWLILGDRYSIGSTYANDRAAALRQLAPEMRFFLGGDSSFRGASLTQLPGDNDGFFTALYNGIELRMGDVLPYHLQPFTFMDAAMGGRTGFHVDPDVYYAPGAGFRWRLPFGAVRGTMARGLVWHRDAVSPPLLKPRWQFFIGLGKEF